MKNKYFSDSKKNLMENYQINVLDDVLLNFQDRVICYADHSNLDDIELEVITGNLQIIGFDDTRNIKLSEIISVFDYNNEYGKIAGTIDYFNQNHNKIYDFSQPRDISFPIIRNGVRRWLRFNVYQLDKMPQISIFNIMDVTKLHTQEEETFAKTHIDSLTKLFNKYTFDYHYGRVYLLPGFHVMYLDLDNFKEINDIYGHAVGDEYLKAIADLLRSLESENNTFYRLGGDEFVGLLNGDTPRIMHLANTIIKEFKNILIPGKKFNLTCSMGVIKATKSSDLVRKADKLMYKIKQNGKNGFLYENEAE